MTNDKMNSLKNKLKEAVAKERDKKLETLLKEIIEAKGVYVDKQQKYLDVEAEYEAKMDEINDA